MKRMNPVWPVLLIIALTLALVSCGGGGGGDAGGDPPPGGGTGSKTNPIGLTVGTPQSGSIGMGGASYYSFTPQSTGFHTALVSNATTSVSWTVFSDAGFTNVVESCGGLNTRPCYMDLSGGTPYYIRVNNFSFGSGTYTISVSAGGGNEGIIGSPVQLTVGAPHNATIDDNGDSYYYFIADRDGSFNISLANTHTSLSWTLYSSATYSAPGVSVCYSGSQSCSTTNLTAGLPYYLQVHNGSSSDDTFIITVSAGASEGSTTKPVPLTVGTSHSGGVGDSWSGYAYSYYTFTTAQTSTSSYNIIISNLTPTVSVGIAVYPDLSFSYGTELANCYLSTQCLASGLSPGTPYYVRVSNATYNSTETASYDIIVTAGNSQGSPAQPVDLTAGQAMNAIVDGNSSSYFAFTTANNGVGGSYTISLTNTQTNLSWWLYSDAAYATNPLNSCNTVTTGPGDETCATTNLDPNKTYYVKVTNADAATGTYVLTASAGGGSEGSKQYPYPLSADVVHDGFVIRYGNSYYTFTTGSTAMTYRISLTNMQTQLDWRLYSDEAFLTDISPVCSHATGTADQICSTTQGSDGVLNANATYYLKVESNTSGNTDSPYSIEVDALDPTAGCSAGAIECFDFQDGIRPAAFAIDPPGNHFTEWEIDTANNATAGSAGDSMKSGTISSWQTTCFSYTRTGTAEILFSLKTSSLASSNYLKFFINGSSVGWGSWSGVVPWRRVWYDTSFVDGTASVEYKWCYDAQSTPGAGDAVWVDDIEFR